MYEFMNEIVCRLKRFELIYLIQQKMNKFNNRIVLRQKSPQNYSKSKSVFQAPYAEAFDKKTSYCYFPVFKSILVEKCQNKRVRR